MSKEFPIPHRWEDLSDEEIEAMADAATEFPPVTDDDLREAVAVAASGRVKIPVSIRLDEETVEFFKAEGAGYQTRINHVLLEYVREMKQRQQRVSEWCFGPVARGFRIRRSESDDSARWEPSESLMPLASHA